MANDIPASVVADPKRPWKAIVAGIGSVIGLLWASLEGRDNLGNMTAMEWASIIVPVVLITIATYAVPNPKVTQVEPRHRGEFGQSSALVIALVVLIVVIILVILVPGLGLGR